MNIPKWLAGVWLAAIVIGSAADAQFAPALEQQAGERFVVSTVFLLATCVTGIWVLWKLPAKRLYVILWAVALFVADQLSHFGPARPLPPGEKFYLSTIGPPMTLAVAGAIMLAVWAARKYGSRTT